MDTSKPAENTREADAARAAEAAKARADNDARMRAAAAREGQEKPSDAPKLSEAQLAAIEEENLRRKYAHPQKDATSVPLQALSANEPQKPDMDEILADTNFPATKADLVLRARTRGDLDDRYAMERVEDRMYMDIDDVKRALRA